MTSTEDTPPPTKPAVSPPTSATPLLTRRPNWEKCIDHLAINSLKPTPTAILLPIDLRASTTLISVRTKALVDTGASGDFIDREFMQKHSFPTRKLSRPIPVYNVDGSPNDNGMITEVVNAMMTYDGHSETILLAVTQLGKQDIILGFTWLHHHNPQIDFATGGVTMNRCNA